MGYIDPGLFGILSQIGAALLLVVVTAFAFFTKPIKKFFSKLSKKDQSEKQEDLQE